MSNINFVYEHHKAIGFKGFFPVGHFKRILDKEGAWKNIDVEFTREEFRDNIRFLKVDDKIKQVLYEM